MSLQRQVPEGWQPEAQYQNFLSKRAPNAQPNITRERQRALEVVERLRAAYPAGEMATQMAVDAFPRLTDEERNVTRNNPGHIPHVDN